LLSICFTPLFIAASVLFAVWSTHSRPGSSPTSSQLAVLAGVCAALAVIAAVDPWRSSSAAAGASVLPAGPPGEFQAP
jgi:hypothetical protein